MDERAVIVAAGRTAIGILCGAISNMKASELGSLLIKDLLSRAGLEGAQIDEVIMGQVLSAGAGQNPARQAALGAELPYATTAMTINKVCGSGLEAVQLARLNILCGEAGIIIAGGQESMTNAPHLLPSSRDGQKLGNWRLEDSLILDGLWDAFYDCHMGMTAENMAERYGITREQQDSFAVLSQEKTSLAQRNDRFAEEIISLQVPQKRGEAVLFDRDEYPRPGTSLESLSNLRTAFKADGTVTAGNASGINDGAAGLVIMSEKRAHQLNLPVLAAIKSYGTAGVDPAVMGTGPVPATRIALEKAGWTTEDLDLVEANEAFAVQALYVVNELGLDPQKVNVNGGAISLGHPVGASGARILVTLVHEMIKRDAKKGLATLCVGGGMGVAMTLERD